MTIAITAVEFELAGAAGGVQTAGVRGTEAAGSLPCCATELELSRRSLITEEDARSLMEVFKVLANDTRLRLLHTLAREGEVCVSCLAETIGMSAQAVSNQLQRLANRRIIEARRCGNQMLYRIVDPCVVELLEKGICVTGDAGEAASRRES